MPESFFGMNTVAQYHVLPNDLMQDRVGAVSSIAFTFTWEKTIAKGCHRDNSFLLSTAIYS
jgi:hypothetical protein